MDAVRINISIPKNLYDEMSQKIAPRQRSRFIRNAIQKILNEESAKQLAEEYMEAASEIKRINNDLEGTVADGID